VRGRYEAANSNGPVILTGDFNSPPTGRDSSAYSIATGKTPPVPVAKEFTDKYDSRGRLSDFKYLDTRVETLRINVLPNFATYTGWSPTNTREWERIDFVFGGSNRRWYVAPHLSLLFFMYLMEYVQDIEGC